MLGIGWQFTLLPSTNPDKISETEWKNIIDIIQYKLSFDGISNEDKSQW